MHSVLLCFGFSWSHYRLLVDLFNHINQGYFTDTGMIVASELTQNNVPKADSYQTTTKLCGSCAYSLNCSILPICGAAWIYLFDPLSLLLTQLCLFTHVRSPFNIHDTFWVWGFPLYRWDRLVLILGISILVRLNFHIVTVRDLFRYCDPFNR